MRSDRVAHLRLLAVRSHGPAVSPAAGDTEGAGSSSIGGRVVLHCGAAGSH